MKATRIIIALAAMVLLAGCSKEEPQPTTPQTPTDNSLRLAGTKWATSYSDDMMVLEFEANKKVTAYFAQSGGAIIGNAVNGTYSVGGNRVTFGGIEFVWLYAHYKLQSATVNGSIMTTKGKECWNINEGTWVDWDDTWNKQ